MAKTYAIEREAFPLVLLGNSRVDVGLNPQSPWIPSELAPAFNMGQPGTNADMSLCYFRHAVAHGSADGIVLAVDFLSYLRRSHPTESPEPYPRSSGSHLSRLSGLPWVSRWERIRQRYFDSLASAGSMTALTDSVITLLSQSARHPASISSQGFSSGEAYRRIIALQGQASLFEEKNREIISKCLQRSAPLDGMSKELVAIHEICRLVREEQRKMIVFIHPYHADVMEIFERTGHWLEFERWKQQIVDLCSQPGIDVWDFSGYNKITVEHVPSDSDSETIMSGYWESGHYRQDVGELILAAIFGDSQSEEFGQRIDQSNIQQHLAEIRTSQSVYRKANPAAVQRVSSLVSTQIGSTKNANPVSSSDTR